MTWAASPQSRAAARPDRPEDGSPSNWTSRSPRRAAWGRTACSSARPARARASCSGRWSSRMAITHSSEVLNFVLVDFKGGATFLGLDGLPHTSAVITNLADEAPLVTRMQDALQGEMMRRQELLRRAGNYSSLREYEAARVAGTLLDPLPTLFVVVDEFSELLASHPDFAELFVMIGRLGRSLGVHLLLASQRIDDGRMHKLESHLSYRIGLRTFSAMESRSVIGVPDAYQLPNAPGNGYIRTDVATLVRFKAAYVSGRYRRRTAEQRQEEVRRQVVPFSASRVAAPSVASVTEPTPETNGAGRTEEQVDTLLQVAVAQLRDAGPPAPPGVAAAAVGAADPRPGAAAARPRPRVRPVARDVARTRRPRRTGGRRGQAVRAGTRPVHGGPVRSRRARGHHRRHPVRQEHTAAHPDRRAGGHPHAAEAQFYCSTSAAAHSAVCVVSHIWAVWRLVPRLRLSVVSSLKSAQSLKIAKSASPNWASTRWRRTAVGGLPAI